MAYGCRYSVSSAELKPSFHRQLKNAFHQACQRLSVGDSKVKILDSYSSRISEITPDTLVSNVEYWLTWGERRD